MPGSRTPVFGEAEDFQAVLSAPGAKSRMKCHHSDRLACSALRGCQRFAEQPLYLEG
jgi:hypothetical protein